MPNKENLLELKTLKIYENGNIWEYTLKHTEHGGLPYYLAPREMQDLHKMYIDEVLFIPVGKDIFNDEYKAHGYRFMFGSTGITREDNMSKMDLQFTICRIRFITNPLFKHVGFDFMITHMYDPLFPNMHCEFGSEDDLQEIINNTILSLIDKYTEFYLDKEI